MNGKTRQRHLVIFARRPRYGVGKRRLAAELGELVAWRFQRTALTTLMRELAAGHSVACHFPTGAEAP